jgi:16S rRNA (adenine1518-N6/adenine1519-N6)-dimethyltransferase
MKRAKPRHSQVFLANELVAKRIVNAASLAAGDNVLEIGPGKGVLTKLLLARQVKLVAIEIDPLLCEKLRARFAPQLAEGQLVLHNQDFLKCQATRLVPAGSAVVANLPYHISSQIILRLVGEMNHYSHLLLMLQDEFVRRLAAKPGSRDYGALSVFVRCRARAKRLFKVSRRHFRPSPTIDSATVSILPYQHPDLSCTPSKDFSSFVQLLFSQRRKQLLGALVILGRKRLPRTTIAESLARLRLDATQRPGTLSEIDFWRLYEEWRQFEKKG